MRRWGICAVALLVALPAGAERPLTYREALQAAVDANPALHRAELTRLAAEGSLVSSRGLFDPLYTGNARYSQDEQLGFPLSSDSTSWGTTHAFSGSLPTGTSYSLSGDLRRDQSTTTLDLGVPQIDERDAYTATYLASLTQELLRGVLLRYNLQNVTLAKQALSTQQQAVERTRQETLANAAAAYWSWVYRNELKRIADTSVEVADEALRVGQLKLEAGELAPVEGTRLEAAAVQARSNALDANNAAEDAANQLLLLMGGTPDQEILPATDPGDVPELELDAGRAAEVALAQNLDLAVARANLESAELEYANARHGRLPSLSATGTLGTGARSENGTAINALAGSGTADPFNSLSIRADLTVPLANRAARGDARRTGAVVEQRRSELEELQRSVSAQVEQQVRTLRSAKQRVDLADANARLAEQTLAAEEALADAGRAIQKDVLEARTELDRARAEAAKARTDYRQGQVELLRLQGQLTPEAP